MNADTLSVDEEHYDAVVIGGGLGGLVAGSSFARWGKKVLLLEQHYLPGGCATVFKHKDYLMEVGLHEMDGLCEGDMKRDIFNFLGVFENVEMVQVPELFRYVGKNIDYTASHGIDNYFNTLIKKYPAEARGLGKLRKIMEKLYREVPHIPSEKWKLLPLLPIFPLLFPTTVRVNQKSVGYYLNKFIADEELKLILSANYLYYHDDPMTLSMVYFLMAQAGYIKGGGHFIKGGSQQLSNYLSRVITEGGGKVLLAKKVDEILMEGGRASGVVYRDSFNQKLPPIRVHADCVIANCAAPLVPPMLPSPYAERLNAKMRDMKPSCSLLSIYIGFKEAFTGTHAYSTFIASDRLGSIEDAYRTNRAGWDQRGFAFVNYGSIDAGLAPEGKSVGVIATVDYLDDWQSLDEDAYDEKKKQVAEILFRRLEKVIPGITKGIECYNVATSRTINHYTLNTQGSPYGFAQIAGQDGIARLPHKSVVKGLYFASAWSFPGGGFTGAIMAGFLCARQAAHLLRHKKSRAKMHGLRDSRSVTILHNRCIAENTTELVVEKPKGFHFIPGQYVIFTLCNPRYTELDIPQRELSIVSHPEEEELRFTFRLSGSSFKKSCAALSPGDRVILYGPLGDFRISHLNRDMVFLISGIGVTPILSLLQELKKQGYDKESHLFYSNRTPEKAAYHQQFAQSDLPFFRYHPVFTGSESRINEQFLAKRLKDSAHYDYYLVGTKGFLDDMRSMLHKKNVPRTQVFFEDFE